jgi:hypothetical protein
LNDKWEYVTVAAVLATTVGPFTLLADRDFRLWFASRTVSEAGTAASAVALPLVVSHERHRNGWGKTIDGAGGYCCRAEFGDGANLCYRAEDPDEVLAAEALTAMDVAELRFLEPSGKPPTSD